MGQFKWDECLPRPKPHVPARRAIAVRGGAERPWQRLLIA